MKRSNKGVGFAVLSVGVLSILAMGSGCAASEDDTDSGNGAVSTGKSTDQTLADEGGPMAPLEKKGFDLNFALTAHNQLNLAEELQKATGASELSFANGAAKVSLDPTSTVTLTNIGLGGSIQYVQDSLGKKHLALLEGHISAKATAVLKANFEYHASWTGKQEKDFHMDFGTPLDKTIDVQWTDKGVVHKFPVNVTINTGATVGCEATANADATASIGAQLDFQYKGGITYHNPTGQTPIAVVPLKDLFGVESTPPSDMVHVSPIDMGGTKTYFTATGGVKGTAACWVRPEVQINVFKFVGVAAGMKASVEATAGAEAKASLDGAKVPASAEFDWTVTPKLELQAWGTAGIGTQSVAKTNEFKLGEFKWEKPFAGKYEGQMTFDPAAPGGEAQQ